MCTYLLTVSTFLQSILSTYYLGKVTKLYGTQDPHLQTGPIIAYWVMESDKMRINIDSSCYIIWYITYSTKKVLVNTTSGFECQMFIIQVSLFSLLI